MGIFDITHALASFLPEVSAPKIPPTGKERLMWTGVALVLFFLMYNTMCFGVQQPESAGLDFLQTITASNIGSLLTAGIGPIVFASIFLQLFNGAGLINLNMRDKNDKKKFLETQKILAICLAFITAIVYVVTFRVTIIPLFEGLGEGYIMNPDGTTSLYAPFTMAMVILQIALGSIIILYLDEILTKYGIGSGISLFIAAGVSFAIMTGLIQLIVGYSGILQLMTEGGAEALPNALLVLSPFLATVVVFLIVVYFEGVKVEIPIAFERVRGLVPKLPLKYFYVSNIPVIFASALIMNIYLFSGMLAGADLDVGGINVVDIIASVDPNGHLNDGLLYLMTPPRFSMITDWEYFINATTPVWGIPEWFHAIFYVITLAILSLLFGLFWVETSNMDAKSVAAQLQSSGLQIPGFRRDPRMLESILNKYIFPLTVLGALSVGILAGMADLTGALGSGTGILLTVGILYRMYEQMEQQQMFDVFPALKFLTK